MSSLDYLDLCRLCLVKDRVSVPIFEGEGDVRQIFLKIAACLPVKVAREDKLPKKICDDCVYKVELLYQFWNTTANAEKQLLQWLGDVSLDDKQGYVTSHSASLMKPGQNPVENRLDGSVMQQVNDHSNNMGMGMMDSMGMGMPMMISTSGQQQQTQQQQQMTSVPMDAGGNTVQNVQAVPGPSAQSSHEQIAQQKVVDPSSNQDEDEDESEEDENSDDECDGDDGLPVKEESEEDPNNSRTIEPTTFVNVSLACDEAGPSGLQQQKIGEMPEMVMPTTDGDPKSGSCAKFHERGSKSIDIAIGRFDLEKNLMAMAPWQHAGSNGSPQCGSMPVNSERGKVKLDNGVDPLESCSEVKSETEEVPPDVSSQFDRDERRCLGSLAHLCEIAIEWCNCDKCGAKFPLENMLKRHKLSHKHLAETRKIKGSANSRHVRYKVTQSRRTGRVKSRYICHICDFACDKRASMSSHLRKKHDTRNAAEEENAKRQVCVDSIPRSDETFACENCSFECKKRSTLESHVSKKHSRAVKLEIDETVEEEPYECAEHDLLRQARNRKKSSTGESLKCNTCGFECTNRSTLYSHKRRHRTKEASEVYSCNECDFKTEKKTSLYSHIKRKHKPPRASNDPEQPELFSCGQCDYKNKNKYELKVHVARKHTDDYKFSCETCNKKFKVKGDLTNHVRFSHREQPVICDVCGKTCLNSNSLYVHQKFAHYKAKYECQVCKRRMVSQENLDEHMLRQHEKRENVVCEECGKTFSRNSRLKIHMRIHTGDKPYDCTICNKSFARRTALKQHLLIHTGMRPYVCDICGKAFTQKPGLISHRKSHPGPLPPLPRVLIDHILNDVLRPPL